MTLMLHLRKKTKYKKELTKYQTLLINYYSMRMRQIANYTITF